MKIIILGLIIGIYLVGCSGGEGKVPVTGTTNLPPGSLDKYNEAIDYSTGDLAHNLLEYICLPDTTQDDCAKNQENLAGKYNFLVSQVESYTDKVHAYTITYSSPGIFGENRELSGEVLVPNLPESKIKGILLYYHGTSFTKYDVPSCLGGKSAKLPSYCNMQSIDSERLSAIMASQGYIVAMPDYVGQGIDNQVMHPYIFYPENNAISGINILIATRSLLDKVGYSNTLNLYIGGLSEGGAYSLWATKLIQTTSAQIIADSKYNLKLTLGISGAYDLKDAQMPMELYNITTDDSNPYNILNTGTATAAKPLVISYTLTAYGFYDYNQDYNNLISKAFLECVPCKLSGKGYSLNSVFLDTSLDLPALISLITSSAVITGYGINGNNSAKALITGSLENDPQFNQKLISASITSLVTTTPIELIYLANDSVVTNLNSLNAYNGIKNAAGDDKISMEIVNNSLYLFHDKLSNIETPIDHQQSQPFLLIAALIKMNQYN